MTDDRFDLQPHVEGLHARRADRLAFRAETPEHFEAWRREIADAVRGMLRLQSRTAIADPEAEKLHERDRGTFVEHKYALDVGEDVRAPVYLLVPKADPPYRPVLVFHGHNPSIQPVLGNYADEAKAEESRARHGNYAQGLAEAGFLVCAVEQRGFGQRKTAENYVEAFACRHVSFLYLLAGRTMVGERCWDGMCAISFLLRRDDLAPNVLGCTGNSGGGTTTLWLSILDKRITVAAPSCYFCSFKRSIIDQWHCECNYVPGLLEFGEMGDYAAALAPRAVRFIAGEHDPIFPVEGVREQFATVRRAYDMLNRGEACDLAVHPDAHRYDLPSAVEWFDRWL